MIAVSKVSNNTCVACSLLCWHMQYCPNTLHLTAASYFRNCLAVKRTALLLTRPLKTYDRAFSQSSIRESVDSLCKDGMDMQYMQYLSKSHITQPQFAKSSFKHPAFPFQGFCDQQYQYTFPKACGRQMNTKARCCEKGHFSYAFSNENILRMA